jgi:hypothetical protein
VIIARGLLEFAVADLDPKFFQQLLLTRLQRMETDQASMLDQALLDLHADLIPGRPLSRRRPGRHARRRA